MAEMVKVSYAGPVPREVEIFVPRVVGGRRAAGNATLGLPDFESNEMHADRLALGATVPGGLQVVGKSAVPIGQNHCTEV